MGGKVLNLPSSSHLSSLYFEVLIYFLGGESWGIEVWWSYNSSCNPGHLSELMRVLLIIISADKPESGLSWEIPLC